MSIQRNTVVTVSPGKYTILSRTFARNSFIVSICAVVTLCKSRFFVCNDLINAASSARYFLYSDNFNSKFPTFAAFKLSFVWYVRTSCNNVSVLLRYLSRSSVNRLIRLCCTQKAAATAIMIAANIRYFFMRLPCKWLTNYPAFCSMSKRNVRPPFQPYYLFRPR